MASEVTAVSTPGNAASLAEQYELGEREPTPAAVEEPGSRGEPSAPSGAKSEPPRDELGRFVSKAESGEPGADASESAGPGEGEGERVQPPVVQHSRRTLALAGDLGLSEEEIRTTSPEALEQVVYHLQRQLLRERRDKSIQTTVAEEQPATAPDSVPSPDGLLGIDESQYDAGLVGVLKAQATKIQELERRLGQVQGFQQARVRESLAEQCDRAFVKHKAVLGDGRGIDMTADDPHFLRRKAVLELVDKGPKKGSLPDRIDRAVEILFGQRAAPALGRGGVSADERPQTPPSPFEAEWREGGLVRPTHRSGAGEPKGREKAEQAVATYLEQQRVATGVPAIKEEFPE